MTSTPEPDFTVCGTPIVELIGHDRLDEHVEQAAVLALANPSVGIAVCTFPGEVLVSEFQTWIRRQRGFLAAWRASHPDRTGTLKLRTRTVVRPGENIFTLAFVVLVPAKRRAEVAAA